MQTRHITIIPRFRITCLQYNLESHVVESLFIFIFTPRHHGVMKNRLKEECIFYYQSTYRIYFDFSSNLF